MINESCPVRCNGTCQICIKRCSTCDRPFRYTNDASDETTCEGVQGDDCIDRMVDWRARAKRFELLWGELRRSMSTTDNMNDLSLSELRVRLSYPALQALDDVTRV